MTHDALLYDIRTSQNALNTLESLTSVSSDIWQLNLRRESEYKYTDDLVSDVIRSYGYMPHSYKDCMFVYTHVTTSANECTSFYKHGILDLKAAYLCADTEIRTFLDDNNVFINLDEQELSYLGHSYDISFSEHQREGTEAYYRWRVGRKFFYDYTTCGFLSVWAQSPYGGMVHRRPEILSDLDNLLKTTLSKTWIATHKPYEIVARVNGNDICYYGDDDQSERGKMLGYLTMAYNTAFGQPSEEVLLLKNEVMIPPADIIEIHPFNIWQ